MKFERLCPTCNKKMMYSNKYHLSYAVKVNSSCRSCTNKNAMNRIEVKKLISKKTKKAMRQLKLRAKMSTIQKEVQNRPEEIAKRSGKNNWKWIDRRTINKWKRYQMDVWNITNQQLLCLLENFDKRGRCGVDGAYQIDHIIGIRDGFENEISPKIIANIKNLQMIPWKENLRKYWKVKNGTNNK